MNILLTGGTRYIGSHAAVVMAAAGHQVVLYDNLCNSAADVVNRLEKILGQRLPLEQGDKRGLREMCESTAKFQANYS